LRGAHAALAERHRALARRARRADLAHAGVLLEDKRYSLSLHYRHAPDHEPPARVSAQLRGSSPPRT
jgi:trehalose-6-phosphatase